MIPDSKVDEVRNATDIVDLVSRYIPLKRSGSTLKACCPFHQEKTPSFHVWPETQTFKCFGCGKGGSVFHFLMERERLTFPEAVRQLAREAGIDLGPEDGRPEEGSGERERLYEVMEWACRFFEARLRSAEGEKAVAYCRTRKISGETARDFRIGYAPAGWGGLLRAARERGVPDEALDRGGLIRTGRREPYDWFRDRLMFPIQDVRGRVVGFGGRAFGDDEPKYLNSPDTELFKKGSMLYALHLAREECLKRRRLAIVEGYTDVLMAHQHGVRFVVAGLGTGLTREHASLVRRYADRVDLVYDADTAGRRAAERALDIFLAEEADVRVVSLPGGTDPCDYLVAEGAEAFLARMEEGSEVFEFLLARAGEKHDLSTLNGRISAVDEVLASVAKARNEVRKEMLIRRAAESFSLSEAAVRDRLRVFDTRRGAIETGRGPVLPVEGEVTERYLAEALVFDPALAGRLLEDWPPERFRHPVYRAIAAAAAELGPGGGPAALAGRLVDPAAGEALAGIVAEGQGKAEFRRQYEDCVARLSREARLGDLRREIEEARKRGDREELARLQRELFQLRGGNR